MPGVDPYDDAAWRWVLHHYRYDPERRERRHMVVAAYDNQREHDAAFERLSRLVEAEVARGVRDPAEHVTGTVWHPGFHAEQVRGRQVLEAIRRGADPARLLEGASLPASMAVYRRDTNGITRTYSGRRPRPPRRWHKGCRWIARPPHAGQLATRSESLMEPWMGVTALIFLVLAGLGYLLRWAISRHRNRN